MRWNSLFKNYKVFLFNLPFLFTVYNFKNWIDDIVIHHDLYDPLVSLLSRYTQQYNQITYTTMCIQCIHLHSLGSFYLHLPHLYSDVILYWLKTTEGFRQKSAYPLEVIQDLNFRLGIQTKIQFWPLIKNFNFDSCLFVPYRIKCRWSMAHYFTHVDNEQYFTVSQWRR